MGRRLKVKSAAARNHAFSAFAAGGALGCAVLGFLGWVVDEPALTGFGLPISIWPLTAIGLAALAAAQLAQLDGRRTAAWLLFSIPLVIGIAGAVYGPNLSNGGIHGLLYGEAWARVRTGVPSRAAYIVMFEWGLLIAAMLLASRQTWRACLAGSILANIPLALSIMSIGLTTASVTISGGPANYLWASLPASIATLLLSLSVFLRCRGAIFIATDTGEDAAGWTFVRIFPLALLVPALTWLLELVAFSGGLRPRLLETIAVGLNMVLIAAILAWAMHRMSRQQAALRGFTNALDSTLVVLMHPDGTVIHWSRGCEQLFGWTAAEAVGAIKDDLLQARFDGEHRDLWSLALGEELEREVTETSRYGHELRVLEHVRRIDTDQDVPVLVVAMTDITERERRQSDLDARGALIRAILDTAPDAIVAFDIRGIIRLFSPGAVRMLGYEAEEAIGRHFTMIAVEARRAAFAGNLERYLRTGVPHYMGHVTRAAVLAKSGVEVPVEMRAVETATVSDRLFILFLRDLTQTIANENRLGALSAELGHVARLSAMGEMAAGMAHELNQPLTAIVNYTGAASVLLEEGGDPARARELVENAKAQTLRAGQIIHVMREFASKGHVEMAEVAVDEMIRDAITLVFVGPMPHEIRLEQDLDPRADTAVVDRIQIQQVLVNLLRNAVQAMERGASPQKEIVISTRLLGNEMIEIGVCDTGPGIPEAKRATMFAPFTTSSNKGGMGIGLSICRRIVEAHGGKIWVETRDEGGSIFRFTVPTSAAGEDVEA